MKPLWFKNVEIEDLPEPFRSATEAIVNELRPLVRDSDQAREVALACVKTLWVAFEGTETYWHRFSGLKFCRARHAAIRADFGRAQAGGGEGFNLPRFLNKWNLTERSLRSICKTGRESQGELFD